MKGPLPRLFRRDEVDHRRWIAFAFDYKDQRTIGFVEYDALAAIALDQLSPGQVFDRDKARILMCAAEKFDRGEFDPEGRVLIRTGELAPLPWANDLPGN